MSQSSTWDAMLVARDARLIGRADVAAEIARSIEDDLADYVRCSFHPTRGKPVGDPRDPTPIRAQDVEWRKDQIDAWWNPDHRDFQVSANPNRLAGLYGIWPAKIAGIQRALNKRNWQIDRMMEK